MREPWDLAAGFIGQMNQETAQSKATADNALLRMIAANIARQDAATSHGYGVDMLGQRNQFATQADTIAFDRQLQRDNNAYGVQDARRSEDRAWQQEDAARSGRAALTLEERKHQQRMELEDRKATANGSQRRFGAFTAQAPASLVQTESGGNFKAQNNERGSGGRHGHFGRVQFGHDRLDDAKRAGVLPRDMTPDQFMNSPALQQSAENWHFSDINQYIAKNGLNKYIGQNVGGVPITQDGIIAMAHLGGKDGAKRYLETGGRYNPSDSLGTSLRDYAKTHANSSVAQGTSTRRYGAEGEQQTVSDQVLATPVSNSTSQSMMEDGVAPPSPFMTNYLEGVGLEPVARVAMTENQFNMLDPVLQAMLVPDVADYTRSNSKGPTEYIQVQPRADGMNADKIPIKNRALLNLQNTTPAPIEIKEAPKRVMRDGHMVLEDGSDLKLVPN